MSGTPVIKLVPAEVGHGVLDIWGCEFFFSQTLVKSSAVNPISNNPSMGGLLRKLLMAMCLLFQAVMVAGRRGGGGFLSTAGSFSLASGGTNQGSG